jgi:hypothetical protein
LNSSSPARPVYETFFKSLLLLTRKFIASVGIDKIILGRQHLLKSIVIFKILQLNALAFGRGTQTQQVSNSFRFRN